MISNTRDKISNKKENIQRLVPQRSKRYVDRKTNPPSRGEDLGGAAEHSASLSLAHHEAESPIIRFTHQQ
jgi:hypothetical protein